MNRKASIKRKTNETDISLQLNLDGTGKRSINTGVGFFDHMLDLMAAHGLFDLTIKAKGDLHIDAHHTVEDIGICLGQAFREALGDSKGIRRYASGFLPMDEALCQCAIDVSNRPVLVFNAPFPKAALGSFDLELVQEFFQAFTTHARITLHVDVLRGTNTHHMAEACFKALGVYLKEAVEIDPRKKTVPSTKGVL